MGKQVSHLKTVMTSRIVCRSRAHMVICETQLVQNAWGRGGRGGRKEREEGEEGRRKGGTERGKDEDTQWIREMASCTNYTLHRAREVLQQPTKLSPQHKVFTVTSASYYLTCCCWCTILPLSCVMHSWYWMLYTWWMSGAIYIATQFFITQTTLTIHPC